MIGIYIYDVTKYRILNATKLEANTLSPPVRYYAFNSYLNEIIVVHRLHSLRWAYILATVK